MHACHLPYVDHTDVFLNGSWAVVKCKLHYLINSIIHYFGEVKVDFLGAEARDTETSGQIGEIRMLVLPNLVA